MDRLRVVIVGAGLMGRWHAAYVRRAGGQLVAVVDCDTRKARDLAQAHGAESLHVQDDWLAALPSDVVHVCTPSESHAAIAEAALLADRHVLVEKPLAHAPASVQRLIDLARHRRRILAPVHQLPFQRGVRRLLHRLDRLGPLTHAAYSAFTAGGEGRNPSQQRQLLIELLAHPLSLLHALNLGGVPTESWNLIRFTDTELQLAAEQGPTLLTITLSLRARPTRHELLLAGSHATALADLYHGYALIEPAAPGRVGKLVRPLRLGASRLAATSGNLLIRSIRREPAYPGLPQLISAFYASIRNGDSPPPHPHPAADAAALMMRLDPALVQTLSP